MTELELEKAVRGRRKPVPDEVGPSYWGIGGFNTWDWNAFKHDTQSERAVTVGNATGRRFKGTHGRGTLTTGRLAATRRHRLRNALHPLHLPRWQVRSQLESSALALVRSVVGCRGGSGAVPLAQVSRRTDGAPNREDEICVIDTGRCEFHASWSLLAWRVLVQKEQ